MFARITSALRSFQLPSLAEVERDYLNAAVSMIWRKSKAGLYRP